MQKNRNRISGRLRRHAAALLLALALCSCSGVRALALELIPVGRTVGITLSCGGLLVSGLTEVETESGPVSPAAEAGVLPGDLITAVNGQKTETAEQFTSAVAEGGERLALTVVRNGGTMELSLSPTLSPEGTPRLGLRLRDGVSGVGTVTFIDPETGRYGALGHPISDLDSGVIMPAAEGNIMFSEVVDVRRGERGCPGELHGSYDRSRVLGTIESNTQAGIFGTVSGDELKATEPLEAAAECEIVTGEATILTNISGCDTESYEIRITRVYSGDRTGRSMMLEITDPRLLDATGGIVQGMSGSPIIQNGKLIGAVTHVLVNEPTKGYGISISAMLGSSGLGSADSAT